VHTLFQHLNMHSFPESTRSDQIFKTFAENNAAIWRIPRT